MSFYIGAKTGARSDGICARSLNRWVVQVVGRGCEDDDVDIDGIGVRYQDPLGVNFHNQQSRVDVWKAGKGVDGLLLKSLNDCDWLVDGVAACRMLRLRTKGRIKRGRRFLQR